MVSGVIPGYRLTREALEADLDRLPDLGVKFHFGQALGRDLALQALRRDFPHVFLGVGAQQGKRLGIPGENAPGVMDALEFLDKVRSGAAMDLGRRVLIIGGGQFGHGRRPQRPPPGEGWRGHPGLPQDPGPDARGPRRGGGLPGRGHRPPGPAGPGRRGRGRGRVTGLACTPDEAGRAGRLRPAPAGARGRARKNCSPPTPSFPPSARSPCWTSWRAWTCARKKNGTLDVDPEDPGNQHPGLFAGATRCTGLPR